MKKKEYVFKNKTFKVTINPFTMGVVIERGDWSLELSFNAFDEWQSFEYDGKLYDIHIHYDDCLTVSIYDVIERERTKDDDEGEGNVLDGDYTNSHKVILKLQLNEPIGGFKPITVKLTNDYSDTYPNVDSSTVQVNCGLSWEK